MPLTAELWRATDNKEKFNHASTRTITSWALRSYFAGLLHVCTYMTARFCFASKSPAAYNFLHYDQGWNQINPAYRTLDQAIFLTFVHHKTLSYAFYLECRVLRMSHWNFSTCFNKNTKFWFLWKVRVSTPF